MALYRHGSMQPPINRNTSWPNASSTGANAGALKKSSGSVGPFKDELPVNPIIIDVNKVKEVLGIGTIFWQDDEPKIHLHSAIGHESELNLMCVRSKTEVFILIEAILQEYVQTTAKRKMDDEVKMPLLSFD